jgi:thioredoxin
MATITLACQFCTTLNKIDMDKADQRPEVPVIVDFYADWCGPCRLMAPILDEIAHDQVGKLLVAKVDTDHAPGVSMRYGIRSIPFFARFENGQMVKTVVGALGREGLKDLAA